MAYNYGLFPIKTQKVTSSGSSAATSDIKILWSSI